MRRIATLAVLSVALSLSASAQERSALPRAGISFQSAETRDLQADESRNPGMLWVEQGAKLWSQPPNADGSGRPCVACHASAEQSMAGVATRYPRLAVAPQSSTIVTLEGQINTCRTARQATTALMPESNDLLALTAFIAYQSRGLPRRLTQTDTPQHQRALAEGHALYQTRQGQLNLACSQCHDGLAGRRLRGDIISEGQTHGWPAYRLEWQTMGSLQRRLRACQLGVRAEVLPFGDPIYATLEYYLAWRGEGLPMESPGVRR